VPFEPGCNVDAVAEDIAVLDDDVADVDAHAKFDAAVCWCRGVSGDHLPLHLDCTAQIRQRPWVSGENRSPPGDERNSPGR
jgi:hypothetical protein